MDSAAHHFLVPGVGVRSKASLVTHVDLAGLGTGVLRVPAALDDGVLRQLVGHALSSDGPAAALSAR